jgi:hypothetical protein
VRSIKKARLLPESRTYSLPLVVDATPPGRFSNNACTVTPTSLVFTPVPGVPSSQTVGVTLWTDVSPGVIPVGTSSQIRFGGFAVHSSTALSSLLGWPLLLVGFAGILGFRKRLQQTKLLGVLVWLGLMTGGSLILNGCSSGTSPKSSLTPVGSYSVALKISGPNSTSQTIPIQFTVAAGVAGQE